LLSAVASVSACEEAAHPAMLKKAAAKDARIARLRKLPGYPLKCFMINSPCLYLLLWLLLR
jgi:hypothetical protein